jgi:hypothetical protein|tara:strand:- start:666 stop:1019 length:354 start_codon:yes stop_codon:yes gene_type:complete
MLEVLEEKYGLSASVGGTIKYDAQTATIKIEVGVIQDGEVMTKEQQFLNGNWKILGIEEERMLNTMLRCPKGKFYYLRGYKQRAYKRPYIIEDAITGKRYMTTPAHVKSLALADDKV